MSSQANNLFIVFICLATCASFAVRCQDATAISQQTSAHIQPHEANTTIAPSVDHDAPKGTPEELKRFEEFKQSKLFAPPFDAKILSMPEKQRLFIVDMFAKNIQLYKDILRDAVANRNKFAPSVQLMFKWTGKLLGSFIRIRRGEQQISPRVEPTPAFFLMAADLFQDVIDKSAAIRKEKAYTKSNVDVDRFEKQVTAILDYVNRVAAAAPMGPYLSWNKMIILRDEPNNSMSGKELVTESADLLAVSMLFVLCPHLWPLQLKLELKLTSLLTSAISLHRL